MNTLLEYENQIYLDMYHNDALLITAEGLGIERIFANFIQLYCDPSNLVLILNTNDAEEEFFMENLKKAKTEHLPTKITTETHSLNERTQVYLEGGCFFVTSRILVVDMLTDRIPIDLITGILVYKAHKVIDSCQESFILRMFRQKNKKGFIKAFSDNPIFFSRSTSKVNLIMKNIFVKNLFIYPRFHVDIEAELSKHKAEVIEVHVGLSENTARAQMALLDILNVLLQEFKGCCSYIDQDFLTMEMVISKPFDRIVKSQLEPVWNHLGSKPKQLINDIKTLRLLLYYLIQYDCITFYKMLNCLRSHEKDLGRSSGWMFLDAANDLFTKAKQRVYGKNPNPNNQNLNVKKNKKLFFKHKREMAQRVVEESPKLKALKEILEELAIEEKTDKAFNEDMNILIVANDDRTSSQIKYFLKKNSLTKSELSKSGKKNKKFDKFDIVSDERRMNGDDEENLNDADYNEDEFIVKLILKPICGQSDNQIHMDEDKMKNSKTAKLLKKANKKEMAESGPGALTLTQMIPAASKPKTSKPPLKKAPSESSSSNSDNDDENDDDDGDEGSSSSSSSEVESENSNEANSTSSKSKMNLFLSAYDGGLRQKSLLLKLLNEQKPTYVILFDCQLWFVRQLEIYKSINFNLDLRVYFLMYTNSCEEQKYLTSIRSEKESFEILVREKATMIVQEEQDGKTDLTEFDDSNKQNKPSIRSQMSSRIGGISNRNENDDGNSMKIIVDMREFRSQLPGILHKRGFQIEPCTLEVGDYVLTPNVCVERKSLNDLIESLANGRLYNQCNAMSRSYKTPILLIEFDRNKPFLLNSYQTLTSNDISTQHTSSKLVLLTMNFPKLRILWCSSPSETAEIFEELKSGCPQPDAQTAMSIKTDEIKEDENMKYNSVIMDLLLKIPGINSKNLHRVLAKVDTLYDLCQKTEEELTEILENSKSAKMVYEFLNTTRKDEGLNWNKDLDFLEVNAFYLDKNKADNKKAALTGNKATTASKANKNGVEAKQLLKIKKK